MSFEFNKAPWDILGFNHSIKKVVIDDGVTNIAKGAFAECINLIDVSIPGSVTSIGELAFGTCRSLKTLNIPLSVSKIPNYMFSDSGIESIILPESIIVVGEYAFSNCASLKSFTALGVPISVASNAFEGCTILTEITVPDGFDAEVFKDLSNPIRVNWYAKQTIPL